MKKLSFILIAALVVLFTGCEKHTKGDDYSVRMAVYSLTAMTAIPTAKMMRTKRKNK